jgi:hypothetical protein
METTFSKVIFATCLLFIASSVLAVDTVRPPKGVYRGIFTNNCTDSPAGFGDPPNQVYLGDGNRNSSMYISVAVFGGDGTITETTGGTTSYVNSPSLLGYASVTRFEETFRYTLTMNANKTFTRSGSCSGYLPDGTLAGAKYDLPGLGGEGQVSEDGSMIIVGYPQPPANTITITNTAGDLLWFAHRLCVQNGTYVRTKF